MSKSIKVNSSQSVRLPYMEHLTVLKNKYINN